MTKSGISYILISIAFIAYGDKHSDKLMVVLGSAFGLFGGVLFIIRLIKDIKIIYMK